MSKNRQQEGQAQPAPAVTASRRTAYRILVRAERSGRYVDHLLSSELASSGLSQADRALVTELVNGVVRWQKKLDWIAAQLSCGDYPRSPMRLRMLLRLGLYQLLFLSKVPDYAAVSEIVNLAKTESPAWGRLVNAILRTFLRRQKQVPLPSVDEDPIPAIAVLQSHPEWLVRRWVQRFGVEEATRLCAANNQRPVVTLRVNLRRSSEQEIEERFREAGLQVSKGRLPGFLRIEHAGDLSQLPALADGSVSVQDESAALAVQLLAPERGDVVLDLCAAPGGKSTYIGELTHDTARVIAVDRDAHRLRLLHQGAHRLGLHRVFPVVADARTVQVRQANRVLLDAPCSGLGVLAKRADLRWRRREEQILELAALQQQLLENAAQQLGPGGVLVYSTCTTEPEENEQVVEDFLNGHPEFELQAASDFVPEEFVDPKGYIRTFPHVHGMDGSFAARLLKTR